MRGRHCVRIPQGLRGHPILAVRAVKVASKHSKAHRQGSRQSMEERFLFDRIELKGANIAMGHEQLASTIESDAADAVEPVEDDAAVSASKASQLAVFEALVQVAFDCVGFKNILECRRSGSHKICFPNAERINSIPKCAVLFCTSRIGLISVISNETIFLVSAIISIARCASR